MNKYAVVILSLALILISSVAASSDEIRAETINKILDTMMDQPPKELFKVWHHLYEPEYSIASELAVKKYKAFKATLKNIKETNAKGLSYKLALNQFSDLTKEEFKSMYLTRKPSTPEFYEKLEKSSEDEEENTKPNTSTKFLFEQDDDDEDRRRRNLQTADPNWTNIMTTPRNQGNCGSCWAFATVAVIEGNYNIKFPKTPLKSNEYLSTQQLIDCDTKNGGCNGGDNFQALEYSKRGLVLDSTYKYTAKKETCKINTQTVTKTKVTAWEFCSNYSSKRCSPDIVKGLLRKGPLTVGIDGSVIQSYRSGIYDPKDCRSDNHAVVLVGSGVENGVSYLIVKNSWGTFWGDKGYIRVKQDSNSNNSCYLENEAILPVLA
jgi:C1A family cysteine protease